MNKRYPARKDPRPNMGRKKFPAEPPLFIVHELNGKTKQLVIGAKAFRPEARYVFIAVSRSVKLSTLVTASRLVVPSRIL